MIESVYKPKRYRQGKRVEARLYRGKYRLPHETKITYVALETTDKRVAKERLRAIVQGAEREHAGLIAPKNLRDAAQKPLAEHLANWLDDLRASHRNAKYIKNADERVTRLMAACAWSYPRDVTTDSFATWRAGQRTLAVKTLNHYLGVVNRLLNWMVERDRITANPLRCQRIATAGHEKVRRRALTAAEIGRLLNVSARRQVVYLMALHTGLRRAELRKLQWGDVHLDGSRACVQLRAETTKGKRADVLPLKAELVDELRKLRPAEVLPGALVFKGLVPTRTTFKNDLAAAKIDRFDSQGRKVDLHALRHTFITSIVKGNVPRRVAMQAARHTDSKLTDHIYTDVSQLPVFDVVDVLPNYLDNRGAQIDSQSLVADRREVSQVGTDENVVSAETVVPDAAEPVTLCHTGAKAWRRRESNPRPVVLQSRFLRV